MSARTWWGQRWLELAETRFPPRTSRFERGETDARTGQVGGLTVLAGRLAARVQGDHVRPFQPSVEVPVLGDEVFAAAADRLGASLRASVELLHDRLPAGVDDAFARAGASGLFPDAGDLVSTCNCGGQQPCRHLAALHHAFARAFDDAPFLLIALRGRERERFLGQLRAVRAGADGVVVEEARDAVGADELPVEGFERARGELARVPLHPHLAEEPAALLTRLGTPPRVEDPTPLHRLVERAARTGWKLAAGAGAEAADDELLLAELRARRMATAGELADALGWPLERTLELLSRLYEAGEAMRTGKGASARYRAS